jgi:hypothetical protein
MVTPASLNGTGWAAAVPAANVDANSKVANAVAFMVVSLSSWILLLLGDAMRTLSAGGTMRKLGPADFFWRCMAPR